MNSSFTNACKTLSLHSDHVLDSARAVATTSNFTEYSMRLEHVRSMAEEALSRTATNNSVDSFNMCRTILNSLEQAYIDWKTAFAGHAPAIQLPQTGNNEFALGRAIESIKVLFNFKGAPGDTNKLILGDSR